MGSLTRQWRCRLWGRYPASVGCGGRGGVGCVLDDSSNYCVT